LNFETQVAPLCEKTVAACTITLHGTQRFKVIIDLGRKKQQICLAIRKTNQDLIASASNIKWINLKMLSDFFFL
jgi:hypothetical protein